MPLPLIKLVFLAARKFSVPVAKAVERGAMSSKKFERICTVSAEKYQKYQVNEKMQRFRGLPAPNSANIQPLKPDEAVKLGGEMIGEIFLYVILIGILVAEQRHMARKNLNKKLKDQEQFDKMADEICELKKQLNEVKLITKH